MDRACSLPTETAATHWLWWISREETTYLSKHLKWEEKSEQYFLGGWRHTRKECIGVRLWVAAASAALLTVWPPNSFIYPTSKPPKPCETSHGKRLHNCRASSGSLPSAEEGFLNPLWPLTTLTTSEVWQHLEQVLSRNPRTKMSVFEFNFANLWTFPDLSI